MDEREVHRVSARVTAEYKDLGFSVVPCEGRHALKVLHADPDRTRYREVALVPVTGCAASLTGQLVDVILTERQRWQAERTEAETRLLRNGRMVDDA